MSYEYEGATIDLKLTVKRVRASVTQQEAVVYCNGQRVTNFGDSTEIIRPGEKYYGELVGDWASKKPDADFIYAALFHIYDYIYHISDPIRKQIQQEKDREIETAKRRAEK